MFHKRAITKGVYGETSKIQEELDELNDAIETNDKIMSIVEMSDLYGALEAVAERYGVTMNDLKVFSDKVKFVKINNKQL